MSGSATKAPSPSATDTPLSDARPQPRAVRGRTRGLRALHVEADLQDVAVGDVVVLALHAQLPELLGLGPRADLEQLVPVDDLGADEAALHVAVDDAGALGGLGAGAERPGPALLLA